MVPEVILLMNISIRTFLLRCFLSCLLLRIPLAILLAIMPHSLPIVMTSYFGVPLRLSYSPYMVNSSELVPCNQPMFFHVLFRDPVVSQRVVEINKGKQSREPKDPGYSDGMTPDESLLDA